MSHLLVTNDFPPKVGGIQSYLWELWRRLPSERVTVLTTPHPDAAAFDAAQPFRVVRAREPVLLPTPALARRVGALAAETGAGVVVLDPALPLGLVGPLLCHPYAVVLHGAEVTVPARLPGAAAALRRVLDGACHVIAAGTYPEAEARRLTAGRLPPVTQIPPGVDVSRFRPLCDDERRKARAALGLPETSPLVVSVSRLVPRKGMDVLLRAVPRLRAAHPRLTVAIAGAGRDRNRLLALARPLGPAARFLGRVPDEDLPALYGCADVFAMVCRNRWGGLEQEGFGIVFLEAAACGVAQVAGRSGGAHEAVAHGRTGLVVDRPTDVVAVAGAIGALLSDAQRRASMGAQARARAAAEFDYAVLAGRLDATLRELER